MARRARSGVKEERREGRERGFVVVWMVIVLTLLIAIAAFAVDLVHAYQEAQHLQNAVDAAALAGAAEIPTDLNGTNAQNQATQLLTQNGFDPSDPSNTVVENQIDGAVPNQLDVEVKHKFDTFFGRVIGFPSLTVHKRAEAQYDAPLAMGSPANNLGDVPHGSCTDQMHFPSVPPTVTEPCVNVAGNDQQSLWAQIQGQATAKSSGNSFTNAWCGSRPTDGCTAGNSYANAEYDAAHPGEYISIVNDQDHAPLYVYIYDAAFIDTVDFSNPSDPCGRAFANPPPHYSDPDHSWCPGDEDQAGAPGGNSHLFTTNYEMLSPDNTPNTPYDNPHYSAPGCTPTAVPGDDLPAGSTLSATDLTYLQRWVQVCAISDAGLAGSEWVLHVSVPNALAEGSNQFSVLALHTAQTDPSPSLPLPGLHVFTRQRLPLFAAKQIDPGHPDATFYVARVTPSSRDRVLHLSFFDLGDSPGLSSDGQISIRLKNATIPGGIGNCQYVAPPGFSGSSPAPPWGDFGPPGACSFSYLGSLTDPNTWNGQWVDVEIPIPSTYTCDPTLFENCWIQMTITPNQLDGSILADATTWNATMGGSPVRLVG